MEVFQTLQKVFKSPVEPYDFQHTVLEQSKVFDRILLKLKGGGGKTLCSIWLGLWHSIEHDVEQIVCIVPAPLVTQWGIVWRLFDVTVCEYQGTPTERRKKDIVNVDVVIMSKNIFRDEWMTRVEKVIHGRKRKVRVPGRVRKELTKPRVIIYDELQEGLRKPGNRIFQYMTTFVQGQKFIGLSATPISSPEDVFGVAEILGSKHYKSKREFDHKHVEERDFFDKVIKWKGLDEQRQVMESISVTVPDECYKELPPIILDRVVYELSPQHKRNYDKLLQDKLLEWEGNIIDITDSENTFHFMQQYVTAPVDTVNKKLLDLLETIYHEDDSPLVIFGNYRVTNQAILEHFGDLARGKWGAFTRVQQQKSFDDFISGKARILVGNPLSLGVGTDGLQDVCYRGVFAELPITSVLFEQCCWRLHRDGQTDPTIIRALTAKGTIQMRLYQACLAKDDLVGQVTEKKLSLREAFKCTG